MRHPARSYVTMALTMGALALTSCQSTGPDQDTHLIASLPGTWDGNVLGGAWVLNLTQGPVDSVAHTAAISGNGTFGQTSFGNITGTLSGRPGSPRPQELSNVVFRWIMPYGGVANAQFQFSGGLHEEADPVMEGFLNAPNGGVKDQPATFRRR